MAVRRIYSFLVSPGKGRTEQAEIAGVDIPLTGSLYAMLLGVYNQAERECEIPIAFRTGGATQDNEFRNLLIRLTREPTLDHGRIFAERLQEVTSGTSGLGLLFIILGEEGSRYKNVISRFPAEQGILAETHGQTLEVSFIEKVFMKNRASYKAALYKGSSLETDFWDGGTVDKQARGGDDQLARYWIRDFLLSDFKTTPKQGSARAARVLKDAVKVAETLESKQQIIAAIQLTPNSRGQQTSIDQIAGRLNLGEVARNAIRSVLPSDALRQERFILDADEFIKHARFQSVELENGAVLTAPAEKFQEVFEREDLDGQEGTTRFTTEGKVVDEKIRMRT